MLPSICSPHMRESKVLDSTPWSSDSRHWILVFVSGTWILDSSRYRDSGFLELYSGFHQQKFPQFRNPDSLTWANLPLLFVHYFLSNIPLLTNQLSINYEQMNEYTKYLLQAMNWIKASLFILLITFNANLVLIYPPVLISSWLVFMRK